jgi:carbon storage regulator
MLVLSRRPGEKLVIGDKVTLSVVEVKGRQVSIGVVAPRDIAIWREESGVPHRNQSSRGRTQSRNERGALTKR